MGYGEDQGKGWMDSLRTNGWAMLHLELCNRNVVPICYDRGVFWAVGTEFCPLTRDMSSFTYFSLFGVAGDLSDQLQHHHSISELFWWACMNREAMPINSHFGPSNVFCVGPTLDSLSSGVVMSEGGSFWSLQQESFPSWSKFVFPEPRNQKEIDIYKMLLMGNGQRQIQLGSRKVQNILARDFRRYYV